MALFMGGTVPAWLKPVVDDDHDGMMGLETFELDASITVYDHRASELHRCRRMEADRVFISLHRESAAINRTADGRTISQ